ncbi:MAG: inositol monophosphatase family protein [Pseudomonadota bacterium]
MADWDLNALAATAHRAADAARRAILPYFRSAALPTHNKKPTGFDPVTEADRAGERAMRAVLHAERPDDGVSGEEFGRREGRSGLTWVLDPIDGTRGFIAGTPTWGVLIAAGPEGAPPLLGVIDQPYIGERFTGYDGWAGFQGPHDIRSLTVSATRQLAEAKLLTTFPEIGTANERQGFQAVARSCRLIRYGMDCYGYALLAMGQIDLVIEAGLAAHDIQAPMAVVRAAGGLVTDWRGGSAHAGGRVIASATPALHARALEILSEVAED